MFSVLKGRMVTRPLLVSFLFLFLLLTAVVSLLMKNYTASIISLILLVFLVFLVSYHFTRNVKANKFVMFIKCIPISFCYVLGRSLSVLDLMKKKLFPRLH